MTDEFTLMGINIDWIPKIIQGFVGQRWVYFNDEELVLTIVSRKKVASCSIDQVGLDDDGNASHETEVEVILWLKAVYLSFVYYISQVPIFYNI